jgi:hypothetical protein
MKSQLRTGLILLVLFLAAWVPRVVALDAFVTVDERKWLARSANFYYALSHGDFASTFQREHPGVTVMWAGTLGFLQQFPDYVRQAPGYFTWNDQMIEAWLKANTSHTPLELLAAGRWWIVLGVALSLAITFLPLRRLLGEPLAALAVLFIAWMPWAVALSRQLHPDGYVSSLIFLSLVFFLGWLYGGRRRRDLVVSGIAMGLAWLTKTPAAFLVPIGAVLVGVEIWRLGRGEKKRELSIVNRQLSMVNEGSPAPQHPTTPTPHNPNRSAFWKPYVIGYVVWGIVASATFFLLWPSMWVNPLGTFGQMTAEMEEYIGGHVNPNFFMGQSTNDPGLIFYPIAYYFRSTPATILGLLAAAVAAWRRARPLDAPLVRRTALGLLIFAVGFALLMSIPAKKFDRYILPVFPALDVLAAMGWAAIALWVGAWWGKRQGDKEAGRPGDNQIARGAVAALVVVMMGLVPLHSFFTALHFPYYLTYFNPLAGGSLTAPRAMIIGWGEGLDQVAGWLNRQPDAEKLKVVSWYHDGPLSYLFGGEPVGVRYGSSLSWLDNDYVVLYINQIQRGIPSQEAIDWFMAQNPALVVNFGGLELARVVDMRGQPLPPFTGLNVNSAADFGGVIRLLAHELDKTEAAPGDSIFAQLYLRSLAPMDVNYNELARLVAPDGSELWRAEGWPWGAATGDWPVGDVRPDGQHVAIPPDTAPGLYKLTLAFYDPATLDTLPVVDATGQPLDTDVRDVALIQVGAAAAADAQFDQPWQFDRYFALSGATLPATAQAGQPLEFALQWDSLAPTGTDYTVFVHLVRPDGQNAAQQDRPPLNGFAPTHLWTAGQRLVDGYSIPLPEDLAPGRYEVRTGLYKGDARLPVSQNGQPAGDYAVVGHFDVP